MATNSIKNIFGGNSYRVCRGLDQGGKLRTKKHLSQDFIMQTWVFLWEKDETPGCVITSDQKIRTKCPKQLEGGNF